MLTQQDIQILLNIIANANIKGADAPTIVGLVEKLKKMYNGEPKNESSKE